MKRYLCLVLTLGLTLPLWAEDPDPMEEMLQTLTTFFDSKTYVAEKRNLVEADLAIPPEILLALQTAELSYLHLLRAEIIARHDYIFEDKTIAIIFKGTKWYRPKRLDYPRNFNDHERNNLLFIERKENALLLRGERDLKGWNTIKPQEPRSEKDPGLPEKRAAIKILTSGPVRVKCGGVLNVKLKITNIGSTMWSPIGKTNVQEGGKYYISSCWIDPQKPTEYFLATQLPFPTEVRSGETVQTTGTLIAPNKPGTYYITFSILYVHGGRFLDTSLPNPQSEFEKCPKLMVNVSQ